MEADRLETEWLIRIWLHLKFLVLTNERPWAAALISREVITCYVSFQKISRNINSKIAEMP